MKTFIEEGKTLCLRLLQDYHDYWHEKFLIAKFPANMFLGSVDKSMKREEEKKTKAFKRSIFE